MDMTFVEIEFDCLALQQQKNKMPNLHHHECKHRKFCYLAFPICAAIN